MGCAAAVSAAARPLRLLRGASEQLDQAPPDASLTIDLEQLRGSIPDEQARPSATASTSSCRLLPAFLPMLPCVPMWGRQPSSTGPTLADMTDEYYATFTGHKLARRALREGVRVGKLSS